MQQGKIFGYFPFALSILFACLLPVFGQPYASEQPAKIRTDWRVAETLRVGDAAPDFKLKTKDFTREVELSSFRGKRPVVLIFGSYSCPSFRSQAGMFDELLSRYKNRVEGFVVYIREANPEGGQASSINDREGISVKDPQEYMQRAELAKVGCSAMNIGVLCLIDRMDDAVSEAYAAWPDRICIVDINGKMAFISRPGPKGFAPGLQILDAWLKEKFAGISITEP